MIRRTTAAAFAAMLATSVAASAQTVPPPMISVSGEAQVSVAPDLAQVDGGVTTEAKTAREASEANNRAMAALLPALKSAGVAEADIQTSRLSLFPQSTQARPNGPMQITGYRASNRVTVRIRDMAKVASTIDALVTAGANEIGGINFMVSKESKALDEARVRALEDAHRKAEIYAKAANVRLGTPVRISEEGHGAPPVPMRATFKADAATPISPGEEILRVSVNVSYEIVK
ncbi:SIMPL domain-containing protein [Bradyrhizobium sp. LHD-71]|uniref:SIMPL domain-containing protein n=1 Tax=Bradyrhizobium sp. LHD-71 TaxID=3072141 RepID=UPI0035BE1F4C